MKNGLKIILAGYLVRFPIGGYAWQAAHYLLGLKALGSEVWFYEETEYYSPAYNPDRKEFASSYEYGIQAAEKFLVRIGFSGHWCFVDSRRGLKYGPAASRIDDLLHDAELLINLGGVNHISLDRRGGRPSIYIDLDPAYTQIKLVNGDEILRSLLNEHHKIFTFGENIGKPYCETPTAGLDWIPTRQPVALEFWTNPAPPRDSYTTVGSWNTVSRDLTYKGQSFRWSKRAEWLRFLDLPSRTHCKFEIAMDVSSVPGDPELLAAHGWTFADPEQVSVDPSRYREYILQSRGEFTVAKDMNIRLRTGWFSDRTACYLAAGRPAVEHDTGFGDNLPLGPGLHAFCTFEDAVEALRAIEDDYQRASDHAKAIAQEYFAAERVIGKLLAAAG